MRYLKYVAPALAAMFIVDAASADTVRVRFQTFYGTEIDDIAKKFQDYVKEASGGSVKIQYFRGGEMVASDQMVEGVSRGTVDIAYGVGSYWPGTVEIGNIEAGLPGAWTSTEEARDVFENKGLGDLVAQAYAEHGVKVVGRGYGSDYDLLTKSPVTRLDDLKSMKIRATSQIAKMLQNVGIATVYLPAQELYIGMSTGVIDGAIYGGPMEYEELKLNETGKNYTFLNLLNPGWIETAIANEKFWDDKLDDAQRKVLAEGIDQYARDIHQWLEDGNQAIIDAGEKFDFAELPAEDSARLTEAAQVVWQEEAAKSDRNKQAVDILTANAREKGRLK
ncbi:TRAP transporter substrate-binding protein DctP [Paracoccus jiaweipingae]|uniref:TRAP transporter substrate-binding protein DctP n=1 Tax=unclassified Paracoccus (in: a-proteobacteria) TaxID=2688777 RepID=UPI0037A938DF